MAKKKNSTKIFTNNTIMEKKNFALIGAAGYIAPRHIKAIADTGNNLMAAYDKFDSVGRLDSSFPDCEFFTENEQFDRFCSKQMRKANPLHFTSICTPNYTHDAFIRYGLRLGTDVICEKPLVLNPWNIDNLLEMENILIHGTAGTEYRFIISVRSDY